MRGTGLSACLGLSLALFAADPAFVPYASVKPILDQYRERLPPDLRNDLKNPTEANWLAWCRRQDKTIRARLEQGDLDSMINLLLYGTSFTSQPRIRMESLTQASKDGILRRRVDDLVVGLRSPGDNERLVFLQALLRRQGIDPAASDGREIGVFIYKNLLRVVQQRLTLAKRAANAQGAARSSLFEDRGVSLDTGIFPDFSLDLTLRDLKQRGVLQEGRVTRVAVIGPGLDFIDKNEESAYDYYPQQTLQPFALYDSLVRLDLAKANALSMTIFDISSRVIGHLQRAHERAEKGSGYVIQLPRDVARSWPPELVAYWRSLGDQVGNAVAPIQPPEALPGLLTRAVSIRPRAVLACKPVSLNIVLERLDSPDHSDARFDLIVATNIFVYYNAFEQALALENVGAMLKPGGLLLTNDRLPEAPGSSMRLAGTTIVPFTLPGVNGRDAVAWYQKF
jgi:hypothetical protein